VAARQSTGRVNDSIGRRSAAEPVPSPRSADPPIRQIVQLTSINEEVDLLFNIQVTHIFWP
jgi:hypothetical protein